MLSLKDFWCWVCVLIPHIYLTIELHGVCFGFVHVETGGALIWFGWFQVVGSLYISLWKSFGLMRGVVSGLYSQVEKCKFLKWANRIYHVFLIFSNLCSLFLETYVTHPPHHTSLQQHTASTIKIMQHTWKTWIKALRLLLLASKQFWHPSIWGQALSCWVFLP